MPSGRRSTRTSVGNSVYRSRSGLPTAAKLRGKEGNDFVDTVAGVVDRVYGDWDLRPELTTGLVACPVDVVAPEYSLEGRRVDFALCHPAGKPLVFVEVKTRSGTTCGSPLEAVDVWKQRRLAEAAQHFLMTRRCGGRPARFDVIGVIWRGSVPDLEHVPNAFEAD